MIKDQVLNYIPEVECPEPAEGQYFVYFLLCRDFSLYCGSTKNLIKRLALHHSGKGAKYTNSHKPLKLIYFETFSSLLAARRREKQLKGWSRLKKINLIRAGIV